MTAGPLRTAPAVLDLLDSTFPEFAAAFNEGQYVLWLGSGISRERVPDVKILLERVTEHLRSNVVDGRSDCIYRIALNEVLELAGLTTDELESVDLSIEVKAWRLRDRIMASLVTKYSSVLDVLVGDKNPPDYLVWTGLNASETYGSPDIEPDVEHYCIAILMLEGLVASAVTANWDGLLEKALAELTSSFGSLVRVVIKPEDFRITGPTIEVIKFHGCAVRARSEEAEYRDLLIARTSQISGWTAQPEHTLMLKHLELLYTERLTLMIGLSAQDANLHTAFATAIQYLPRPWPATPPALVLSEEFLASYHRTLLTTTYGSKHSKNFAAIADSALLGAYGKPTLLALVLSALNEKLSFLVGHEFGDTWGASDVASLQADLLGLRDSAAGHTVPDGYERLDQSEISEFQRGFLTRLIDVVNMVLTVFRTGSTPIASNGRYRPLSDRPVAHALHNADFPSRQYGLLGVALALIGRGHSSGAWTAGPGGCRDSDASVLRLVTPQRRARVFFVKDAGTLTTFEMADAFDESDGDVLIVVAEEEPPAMTRSPRLRYGRDGKTSVGRFNVASNVANTASLDDLYEAFVLAGGF